MISDEYNGEQAGGVSHLGNRNYAPRARRVDDGISLVELWTTLRGNRRTVLVIAAVVFVLVMTSMLASYATFKSTGRLYLGELQGRVEGAGQIDLSATESSEASSEIELLRSRSMVKRAILASGMNVSITPPGWSAPNYGDWLLAQRNPKVFDTALEHVSARDTSLDDERGEEISFQVRFTGSTDYEVLFDGAKPVLGTLGKALKLPNLTLLLNPGRRGSPALGATYDVTVHPLDMAVEDALDSLEVSVPKAASGESIRVLKLEFWSGSPHFAASFLQHLMQAYLEARQSWKTEDAAAAESFVGDQLKAMQQSLDRTQQKLAHYRAENGVVVLDTEPEEMVQQIGRYQEQRVAARLQVASLLDIRDALKRRDAPLEAYMFGEASDAVLQQLASSLQAARLTLSGLEARYRRGTPEVQKQRAKVRAQLTMIEKYVTSRLDRAEKNLASLDAVVRQSEGKLKSVPSTQLGLTQIARESEVYSRMYSYLLERQQQAAIVKASTVSKNRILDPPEVPFREDSPSIRLHLASGILGLLLGAAFVLLYSLFSGVFRSEGDVRTLLGYAPVFASVPWRSSQETDALGIPPARIFDVFAPTPDARFAEAFRSLRTNLYRAFGDAHGKVVLITSPSPGDGKTTCTLTAAAMLAADSRRVLVVDVSVRKPTHHLLTGLRQEPGLRDLVLQIQTSWRSTVQRVHLSLANFDCLTAGAPAQAELLSEGHLASLLVHLRSHYDFIFLDGPSYPTVSDSLTLAPMSDFVVSVIRVGNTRRELSEEHVASMRAVARGHAIVINNTERAIRFDYGATAQEHPVEQSPSSALGPLRLPRGRDARQLQ